MPKSQGQKTGSVLGLSSSAGVSGGRQRSVLSLVLGAGITLAILVVVLISFSRHQGPPKSVPPPPLTSEEASYLSQIEVSGAHMSAAENLLGTTVTYLDAQVTNKGARRVQQVEISLEFHDIEGRAVGHDNRQIILPHAPPLKPGETRPFQVSFEKVPPTWNLAPPAITVTRVTF